MNERIQELIEKIQSLSRISPISLLEKDLLLQHTRMLYEQFAALEATSADQIQPAAETTMQANTVTAEAPLVMSEPEEPLAPAEEPMQTQETATSAEHLVTETSEETTLPEATEPDAAENTATAEETGETVSPAAATQQETQPEEAAHPEATPKPEETTLKTVIPVSEEEETFSQADLTFTSNEHPFHEPDSFELEPELKAERPILGRRLTDFKLWNRDIRSYIGINDKYNFISELFGNNAEAYEEILEELNRCGSMQDAISFLNNSGATTLYRWKEDGFSEQIFYNILSQFFAAR